MDVSGLITQGLNIMVMGVGVVFVVLAVFFGVLKLMTKIWPAKD